MFDFEIISGADAIAHLGPHWVEAQLHRPAGAFEQFELVRPAAAVAEQRGAEPFVVVIREAGRIVSLLALRREWRYGVRAALPLLQPLSQYTDVAGNALEPACFEALCKLLAERGIDLMLLRKVRADSGLGVAMAVHGISQRATERALFIDLKSFGSMAAYEASFSSTTRRNRRQRRQKIETAAGPLSFGVLRGLEAEAAFILAARWKRRWLSGRGASSPVFDGGAWEAVLRGAVLSGAGIVTCLKAGGKPIAIELGFADGNGYMAYLGAFDPEHGACSPGQEQMLRTIGWCFEQGFDRYDLLAPADGYKRQWARADTGVLLDDYAIALTQVGRGVAQLRRHVRPLARDFYLRLRPEMRAAGNRLGVPAAAAAAAVCAGMVMAAFE